MVEESIPYSTRPRPVFKTGYNTESDTTLGGRGIFGPALIHALLFSTHLFTSLSSVMGIILFGLGPFSRNFV